MSSTKSTVDNVHEVARLAASEKPFNWSKKIVPGYVQVLSNKNCSANKLNAVASAASTIYSEVEKLPNSRTKDSIIENLAVLRLIVDKQPVAKRSESVFTQGLIDALKGPIVIPKVNDSQRNLTLQFLEVLNRAAPEVNVEDFLIQMQEIMTSKRVPLPTEETSEKESEKVRTIITVNFLQAETDYFNQAVEAKKPAAAPRTPSNAPVSGQQTNKVNVEEGVEITVEQKRRTAKPKQTAGRQEARNAARNSGQNSPCSKDTADDSSDEPKESRSASEPNLEGSAEEGADDAESKSSGKQNSSSSAVDKSKHTARPGRPRIGQAGVARVTKKVAGPPKEKDDFIVDDHESESEEKTTRKSKPKSKRRSKVSSGCKKSENVIDHSSHEGDDEDDNSPSSKKPTGGASTTNTGKSSKENKSTENAPDRASTNKHSAGGKIKNQTQKKPPVSSIGGGGGSGSGRNHSRKVAVSSSGENPKRSNEDSEHALLKKIDTGFKVSCGTKRKRCDSDEVQVSFKKVGRVTKTARVRIHHTQIADNELTVMQMRNGTFTLDLDITPINASTMLPLAPTTGFPPEPLAKFKELPAFVADDEIW
jgi:hypothetical protein